MAGAGYKLFNTGDVLTAAQVNNYLQEQVTMVFASSAARTSALSGVLAEGMMSYLQDTNAVQVYNGSAWVNVGEAGDITAVTAGTGISGGGTSGDVTITNSMATAIDAKGDLIAGTADNAFDRLAVGNNGETLVADSSATTGLRWQSAANTNAIINGGFDIWQRGTSGTANSSSAGAGYNADRWQNYSFGNAITVSRQATGDSTNLPFIQYCARVQRNSGQTGTNALYAYHTLETADSLRFAGRTVVLSFYARKGANFSASSDTLVAQVQSGTGTDQNIPNFTGLATPINGNATLTTTWQRFTFTGTIASTATEVGLSIYYNPTGTASTNDYFEITGVQLEFGSVATTFKRAGATLAGELGLCQRYYQKSFPIGTAPADNAGVEGSVGSTNSYAQNFFSVAQVCFPVQMRVSPTVTYFNPSAVSASKIRDGGGNNYAAYTQQGPQPRGFTVAVNNVSFAGGGTLGFVHYTAESEL